MTDDNLPSSNIPSSPFSANSNPEPPFPIATPTQPSDKKDPSLEADIPANIPPSPSAPEAGEPAEVIEPIFKRIIPLAIGLVIIIVLFLLVTKVVIPALSPKTQSEPISLTYWGLWEPENIVSQVITDYQAEHPNITIQYIRQSSKDYRERLQSALAKGGGPDIFRWHNTWLPMLKADLAPVPDTIYSPSDYDSNFYPIVKKDVTSNGNRYGIPLEFDSMALYVNQDIFQAEQISTPPTTWDSLRQVALKLKQTGANGNLVRGGVALGTTSNIDNFSDILGLMILQNGGNPGAPDDPAVTSALKFYTLFALNDHTWDDTLPSSSYAFATEKVAMIIAPSWRALEIKQINPQLNFKLYPVPQLPGTNIAWATYWVEGVAQKSAHSKEAFDFLKYLSSPEVLTKMYQLSSQTRLFGEPYSRVDMASSLQQDPFVGAIINQAISAQSWPLASNTYDNGLNDKLIKYYEDAINSFHKLTDEKNITLDLTQGISQVLAQYGLAN